MVFEIWYVLYHGRWGEVQEQTKKKKTSPKINRGAELMYLRVNTIAKILLTKKRYLRKSCLWKGAKKWERYTLHDNTYMDKQIIQWKQWLDIWRDTCWTHTRQDRLLSWFTVLCGIATRSSACIQIQGASARRSSVVGLNRDQPASTHTKRSFDSGAWREEVT